MKNPKRTDEFAALIIADLKVTAATLERLQAPQLNGLRSFEILPTDPCAGDEIRLVDGEGNPDGMIVKVKRVLSGDRAVGIWEVTDNFNQHRFITPDEQEESVWIEVMM